jgi:hypothetical protein
MPVEVGVWRIDKGLKAVSFEAMEAEARLEGLLEEQISIAAPHLMVIGRQVRTAFDKIVDLLAIDIEGNLAILELKRDKTYRDIVAQVLDYGSWVADLRDDDIARIFQEYQTRWHPELAARSINEAFCARFSVRQMPEELNGDHELIIVAASLDPSTERIVRYLGEHHEVNINAVFFRFFRDGDREYLTRAWLREPAAVSAEPGADTPRGDWNDEYYVSFGAGRNWEEARKYGFVAGGGGAWYSNTLSMLQPGARIWVNTPGVGYVGVGQVVEPRVPIEEFMVDGPNGARVPISSLPLDIAASTKSTDDPDKAEYLVRVHWIKTVDESEAVKERGFFGNQNTVARPRTPKWAHTVERLKARFSIP